MINNNSIQEIIKRNTLGLNAVTVLLYLFPVAVLFYILVLLGKIEWNVPDLLIPHRKEFLIYTTLPLMVLIYPFLFKIRRWLIREIAGLCWETKEYLKNLHVWSYMVKHRDGHACIYCGKRRNLNSHHIAPKSIYPGLKFDIDNGITVCNNCHQQAADIFKRLQQVLTMKVK